MRHGDFRFRHQIGQLERQAIDGFDPVMQKENLAATLELAEDRIANQPFVIAGHVGLNRQPIDRRRFNDAQIADADQRHVQGARDRRRREA